MEYFGFARRYNYLQQPSAESIRTNIIIFGVRGYDAARGNKYLYHSSVFKLAVGGEKRYSEPANVLFAGDETMMNPYTKFNPLTGEILLVGYADTRLAPVGADVIPVTAIPDLQYVDVESRELVNMPLKPGEFYVFDYKTKAWAYNIDAEKNAVIAERNQRLFLSDWTDTVSARDRLGPELYSVWQTYRQALRDVPSQTGFPASVVWPTPPP